jgi:hypothetical protein
VSAPLQVIVLAPFVIGSPKEGRRLPPPPYRRERRERWRPQDCIPQLDKAGLRRRVEKLQRGTKQQREALLTGARLWLRAA